MALGKMKGAKPSPDDSGEEEAPSSEREGDGDDYKKLAKEAAKDGDWDAMIDALCSYIDKE